MMCPPSFLIVQITQTRAVCIWHIWHFRDRESFWRIGNGKVSAISARCLPLGNFAYLSLIQPEIELSIMIAQIHIFSAFRIFVQIIIRYREDLPPADPKSFQCLGKCILMGIVADH